MTFLPIVERELRVTARRRSTYWLRVMAACVAGVISAVMILMFDPAQPVPSTGHWLFEFLSWLGLAYVLLVGVATTSDSLSREKREGTLGLLFLTDLKGYDVVLGKLTGTSWSVFYGLVAMLPVLAFPILIGGVTAEEYARMAVVWVNGLLFSLAAGLAVSSWSRDERTALGGGFALVLSITVLIPLVGVILEQTAGWPTLGRLLFIPSPICACWLAFAATFDPLKFSISIAAGQLLSWFLLALACASAQRVWSDGPRPSLAVRWRARWSERCREFRLGKVAQRSAFRSRALAVNPLFWLLSRNRIVRWYPWFFLVAMLGLWAWGMLLDRSMVSVEVAIAFGYVTHLIFKLWVVNFACYSFSEERNAGALELLLSTPLSNQDLLRGSWLTLRRLLGWPFVAVIGAELLLMLLAAARSPSNEWKAGPVFIVVAGVVVFLADSWALYWKGMLAGLRHYRPQTAVWTTIGLLLLVPSFFIALVIPLMESSPHDSYKSLLVGCWLFVSLVFDLVFGLSARVSLQESFRAATLSQFTKRRLRAKYDTGLG